MGLTEGELLKVRVEEIRHTTTHQSDLQLASLPPPAATTVTISTTELPEGIRVSARDEGPFIGNS